jgi:hypothetical protein
VLWVIYARGLDDNWRDYGGWNLRHVVHKSGQFLGLSQSGCNRSELQHFIRLANNILEGRIPFNMRPYLSIRNFMGVCYGRSMVFVVRVGGHEFFRPRHRGERPTVGPGCANYNPAHTRPRIALFQGW